MGQCRCLLVLYHSYPAPTRGTVRSGWRFLVLDLVYLLGVIAVFALLWVVARGVERL